MGNKTSKNFEPVFYNKDAGVIFNRLQADQLVHTSSSGSGGSSTGSPQSAAAAAARHAQEVGVQGCWVNTEQRGVTLIRIP